MSKVQFDLNLPSLLPNNNRTVCVEGGNNLDVILKSELGDVFDSFFEESAPKGYILVFHNGDQIFNIQECTINSGDTVEIIASISGG